MRIVYFCNIPRNPTGGTNVIYRHANRLNNMGITAVILNARRRGWRKLSANIATIDDTELRANDYVIVPEISAAEIASKLIPHHISYGIFVQNGYYLSCRSRDFTVQDIDIAYQNAAHILSISDHTTDLIKLCYPHLNNPVRMITALDHKIFYLQDKKENLITYMPRKNIAHVEATVFALTKNIPTDWQLLPIDKLSQENTAALLRKSRIFLSFSNLEGLGLPPIEAALCGNKVIGYHGGGGMSYWQHPNFEEVAAGDVQEFVRKVKKQISTQENRNIVDGLKPVITELQQTYSQLNEDQHLLHLKSLVQAEVAGKPNHLVPVTLQNRSSFLHALIGRRNFRRRTPVQNV